MANNPAPSPTPAHAAQDSLAPGELTRIAHGLLAVDVAAAAGGRIAQISYDGKPWLIDHSDSNQAMIAWGSYPMLPWAGRVRHGRFRFQGHEYQLARNFGEHAIHGIAFAMPWQIQRHDTTFIDLSLQLPEDERWPFGGLAQQHIEVRGKQLRMLLSLTAGKHAMPATIGWHPWFRKPDRLEFNPALIYPRDRDGIATLPLTQPTARPWDDCFINRQAVILHREGQSVRLSSDRDHWVVYDETSHATCVEPQSGPPDAFNLLPGGGLAPRSTLSAWFQLDWIDA
jgi:aldose 1-epimerase